MRALFTDTLGGDTRLITDEQATRAAIEEDPGRLTACDEDDVVGLSLHLRFVRQNLYQATHILGAWVVLT
jgi:hypothetical protein